MEKVRRVIERATGARVVRVIARGPRHAVFVLEDGVFVEVRVSRGRVLVRAYVLLPDVAARVWSELAVLLGQV